MREKKAINIQIGNQVKKARETCHLTQEQFAERVEVSPQYVSDLERGAVGISIPTLKKVCAVLGVSADQILFGKKSQNRVAAIEERCVEMTDEQFSILMAIVEKYAEAVALPYCKDKKSLISEHESI